MFCKVCSAHKEQTILSIAAYSYKATFHALTH